MSDRELDVLSDVSQALRRIDQHRQQAEEGLSEEAWERILTYVRSRHAGVIQMLVQGPKLLQVVITDVGQKKIQVIKTVRGLCIGLDLKEAKNLVESAPSVVIETTNGARAVDAAKKLREVGAEVKVVEA